MLAPTDPAPPARPAPPPSEARGADPHDGDGDGAGSAVRGEAHLSVELRGAVTRVRELAQRQPARLFLPRPHGGEPATCVVANLSGGLLGGDRLTLSVAVGAGATLSVIGQSAERVYRSLGEDAIVDNRLRVGPGATLEWLPQGTILFEGSRLRRTTRFDLDEGARLIAGELVVLGRVAMGETLRRARLADELFVRVGGRLRFADLVQLGGENTPPIDAIADHPALLGGARASATALYAGPDAASLLDAARDLADGREPADAAMQHDDIAPQHDDAATHHGNLGSPIEAPDGVLAGVTLVDESVLLARFLGRDPFPVRRRLGAYLASLRARALGHPARLPSIWAI